jgi:hypothetical protein
VVCGMSLYCLYVHVLLQHAAETRVRLATSANVIDILRCIPGHCSQPVTQMVQGPAALDDMKSAPGRSSCGRAWVALLHLRTAFPTPSTTLPNCIVRE